jgi:hypothetical protein
MADVNSRMLLSCDRGGKKAFAVLLIKAELFNGQLEAGLGRLELGWGGWWVAPKPLVMSSLRLGSQLPKRVSEFRRAPDVLRINTTVSFRAVLVDGVGGRRRRRRRRRRATVRQPSRKIKIRREARHVGLATHRWRSIGNPSV